MGARRGGGGARVGRRPPPLKKKNLTILVAFLLLFLHMGAFLLYMFSSFLGAISPCGGLFATFYFMVGAFFWACPLPTKISADAHDCKEGSRACSPEIFLCDRNLVSSGHVLLRFCLKNDKNNDKL